MVPVEEQFRRARTCDEQAVLHFCSRPGTVTMSVWDHGWGIYPIRRLILLVFYCQKAQT